jgi:hypothetical protein
MMPLAEPVPMELASHRWLKFTRTHTDSLLFSVGVCTLVVLLFMASSEEFLHWFILPVWLCGVMVSIDAYDWARGRTSLFDPVGVIGAVGLHFFFLSPLLHVAWNYYMSAPMPPLDWRTSLGGMAALNAIGLIVYRACRDVFLHRAPTTATVEWRLNKSKFIFIACIMLVITAFLQGWVYSKFGGILGYMHATTDTDVSDQLQGMGFIFLVSETFPILAMALFAVQARDREALKSWPVLAFALVVFLLLRILFGGLRGSRSTILFALLWASGIVHFYVRPIPRQFVLLGVAFMVMFMYGYGFYKAGGPEGLVAAADPQARAQLTESSGRDLEATILGDLSRSDVQAYILDKLWPPGGSTPADYNYAWGRTYYSATVMLVPRSLWPDRPPLKVLEGTELFYGIGSYKENEVWSSKLYGLAGEAMLNFGPLAIPFAFAIFGLAVSLARRLLLMLPIGDSRLLMYPFLTTLCVLFLTADSDNIVFYLVQHGTVPFLVMLASSIMLRKRTTAWTGRETAAVTS